MSENNVNFFIDDNISNDVVIFISRLTYEEIKSCDSFEDVFKTLRDKKKLVALMNVVPTINKGFKCPNN